jgi:hypothetical protein
MPFRRPKRYFYMSCLTLILLVFTLLCGCVGTDFTLNGNNSDKPAVMTPGTVTAIPNTSSSGNQVTGGTSNSSNIEKFNKNKLENAWKTLRIINTDANERYMKLDLSKSDDINYLRYLMIPETVRRIEQLQSELHQISPVNEEDRNEAETLIKITNYTILKYEGLSTVMHASQFVSIGDPVKMKAELRKAKFQVMDALDIINEREISEYPSMYRDQVAADKRELDEMASQIESFTRSVYLTPPVYGSGS